MKCFEHPTVEAIATCTSCGRAICQESAVDVAGRLFCQPCVASGSAARYQIQVQASQPGNPTNALAIVGLVLGILGLCGGPLFSAAAWITSHYALKQITENPNQEGTGLANAGKWLGIILTILWVAGLVCYLGFIFLALIQGSTQQY